MVVAGTQDLQRDGEEVWREEKRSLGSSGQPAPT